jgi:hypothetical protein
MDIVLRIPDEVVPSLNSEPTILGRQALEALALDLFAQDKISEHELGLMLGMDNRFDVDAFLKSKNAQPSYTLEDLIRDRELARNLFPKEA